MAIRIGFTLIGHGHWSGGENYLRNMLGVIQDFLSEDIEPYLFLTPQQAEKIGDSLTEFLAAPPVIDTRIIGAGQGKRALTAFIFGSDKQAASLFSDYGINVVFESAQFYGSKFPIPVLSWIPDFQHRRLAHLFPKKAWYKRDFGFRLQTNGTRVIMLSSQDALKDCETFYPKMHGQSAVVPFAIDLNPAEHYPRIEQAKNDHNLPERYFYLPNQYWTHKNHRVVIEALGILAQSGELSDIPPVILTGRTTDPRDPELYDRDMARAHDLKCEGHFRHLGLIPYADVFALNAGCLAMINPSRFEGWSTPVEEAKALGTPMLLSRIGLHQEQAPDAHFFGLEDPQALADLIRHVSKRKASKRASVTSLAALQMKRRRTYAGALLEAIKQAIDLRS